MKNKDEKAAVKKALEAVIVKTSKDIRKAKTVQPDLLAKLSMLINSFNRLCVGQEQKRPVTWGDCLENPELEAQFYEQDETENENNT